MGWRIKHVSTGGLLVMACAAALSASAGGTAAGERKLAYGYALQGHAVYAAIGATTRAPIGWLEFCVEYKQECRVKPSAARDVVLTSKAWTDLVKVNAWVNHNVKPITDLEHWGVVERWSYPDDGYGDCEDYVLLKRRMLIKAGWPRSALLVTVVRDKKGAGHAVLTVKTNRGEGPALGKVRLPFRETAIAVRPEHLGHVGRAARRPVHGLGPLTASRKRISKSRSRSRPHPSPSPDRVRERPASPKAGRTFFWEALSGRA
jgi:predicted transglutaminase-like cysteine proteinase